ncbi:hypothetical protein ROHU_005997 [Labeo rohita]|uniref:ribonuclease H n=1 Tax=Labeo rohita TaxID=84645 RepID=A0A498MTG2_LABRO|nr:hypothetical protein ROHU_005997 [Labeo rohita]
MTIRGQGGPQRITRAHPILFSDGEEDTVEAQAGDLELQAGAPEPEEAVSDLSHMRDKHDLETEPVVRPKSSKVSTPRDDAESIGTEWESVEQISHQTHHPLPTPRPFPQSRGGRTLVSEPPHAQPVEHVSIMSPPSVSSFRRYHEPQIPSFVEGEDVESFFVRFERIARTWGLQANEWAAQMVTLLTGKALEAYVGMDEQRSSSYDDIKAAVLAKYNVTEETYRLRFRSLMVPAGENVRETYNRIKGLYKRWMRPEMRSKEQLEETIILEQYLRVLRPDVRIWVKEHQPRTGEEAAGLAERYLAAHRESPRTSKGMDIIGPLVKSSSGHQFSLVICDYATRQVRGPLDMLKEEWTAEKPAQCSIASYILQIRDKLKNFRTLAKDNLLAAQQRQKVWYDTHARETDLKPGQKVLVLLPSGTSKLLTKWQGPYIVTRKLSPVTYEILCPERKQPKQVLHVNLLKEFKERTTELKDLKGLKDQVMMVKAVVEEDDETEMEPVRPPKEDAGDFHHLNNQQQQQLTEVVQSYPSLFQERPSRTKILMHNIILKDSTPIRQKPYRVPERMVEQLKTEIETMLEMGIIEPSTSEWSSPILLVPKKDGGIGFCTDFRKLNSISCFDSYPMPRIDELIERLGKASYITTLDLCKGYWQVPLDPSCKSYTAFRSPTGLYQYTILPFGLHGAPATFQRLMDQVLAGCEQYAAAYLDDVVIYSGTWQEHLRHLDDILKRLQEAGLTINTTKCSWAQEEVKYLGYLLGHGQIRPQVEKLKAIRNIARPQTKRQVRSFLGLIGWYHRFIPHFASLATPLTDLTKKSPFFWTNECEEAFNSLKDLLCQEPVLQSPNFSKRFIVQVDASDVGLGAVLVQGKGDEERPVLFLSRKLFERERKYSTFEKEGLAIKWAVDSLRYYLLGREFTLRTDHRALKWMQTMQNSNSRILRWCLTLQPYVFTIEHCPGKKNFIADYLSRLPDLEHPEGVKGRNVV